MECTVVIYTKRGWKVQMKDKRLFIGQDRYDWNTRCDKVADQAKMLICRVATELQITTLTLTYVLYYCLLQS